MQYIEGNDEKKQCIVFSENSVIGLLLRYIHVGVCRKAQRSCRGQAADSEPDNYCCGTFTHSNEQTDTDANRYANPDTDLNSDSHSHSHGSLKDRFERRGVCGCPDC